MTLIRKVSSPLSFFLKKKPACTWLYEAICLACLSSGKIRLNQKCFLQWSISARQTWWSDSWHDFIINRCNARDVGPRIQQNCLFWRQPKKKMLESTHMGVTIIRNSAQHCVEQPTQTVLQQPCCKLISLFSNLKTAPVNVYILQGKGSPRCRVKLPLAIVSQAEMKQCLDHRREVGRSQFVLFVPTTIFLQLFGVPVSNYSRFHTMVCNLSTI